MAVERLSDLQLAVLGVLWREGEATVARVRDALADERDLAPTTVATILSRLASRGVVERRTEGRQFLYRAALTQRDVRRSMIAQLTERLFQGDPASLVSHLVEEGEIDEEELDRLRSRLAEEVRDDDR
jgi:predicted transcriptional regulator